MASSDAQQPRSVGRYELLFRIASGGMAEVYAGRVSGEAGFQKLVAVKRMLPQLADDDEFVTMFLDEARVAANISSPNCVSTIDLGRADDGSLYIVMELVVGVTLARILKWSVQNRQPIPVSVAVDLLAQAGHGLHDAHEATTPLGHPLQIVHRDVSPQNVLVGVDGRVRLTDFGVARAVARMTETVTGRVKGKFAYMAPEQLVAKDVDRRSDVFSLGIVAWELFTGQRLFIGEHPAETMDRVRNMPILSVQEVRADVPKQVSDVVGWALERDPSRRCPTARDFEDAIRAAAAHANIPMAKEDVVRFVRSAGGDALAKIRDNIKVALSSREGVTVPIETPDMQLTPSGVQSSVKSMPRVDNPDPTDPTTGSTLPPVHPDASAPSAVAGPGSVFEPPQLPDPAPVAPSRPPMLVIGGAIAALVAVAAIAGYVLFYHPSELPPTVHAAPPTPTPEPAPTTVPDEVAPAEQPEVVAASPMETGIPVVDDGDAVSGAPEAPHHRTGRRTPIHRATRQPENGAMESPSTAQTTMENAAATSGGSSQISMASNNSASMMGLVGLDAFDRDLPSH